MNERDEYFQQARQLINEGSVGDVQAVLEERDFLRLHRNHLRDRLRRVVETCEPIARWAPDNVGEVERARAALKAARAELEE